MTNTELETMRELVYIANEIAYSMACRPELSAMQHAGDVNDPDSELARLARAIAAAKKITAPWEVAA